MKDLKDIKFLTDMSGAYVDKWKLCDEFYRKKRIPKTWSGQQPENKSHIADFQDIVPKINYKSYFNFLISSFKSVSLSKKLRSTS